VSSGAVTRLLRVDDARELAEVLVAERAFMAPWEPVRDDAFFTDAGQEARLRLALAEHEQGRTLPLAILDDRGALAGNVTLSGITRGAFLSADLGYWVRQSANGRGLATAAVREVLEVAFRGLGLHRVQAGTLPHNARSQQVLAKNGFVRYGLAPRYLCIAGRWQDHVLYQRLSDDV
jgi:ribosomal-protein-alanine N-acetyltransferase